MEMQAQNEIREHIYSFRFMNPDNENNWYINSVLQPFLRILFEENKSEVLENLNETKKEPNRAVKCLKEIIKKSLKATNGDTKIKIKNFRKELSREYDKSFAYQAMGDPLMFLHYLFTISPSLIKVDQKDFDRICDDAILWDTNFFKKSLNVRQYVVDRLFKIEFIKYSQENHDESWRSHSKKWFTIPMGTLIPCMEKIYAEGIESFHNKVDGKLAKLYSASLRNNEENHYSMFLKILRNSKDSDNHRDEARILNKIPKYFTFFFEYKNYFDNTDWGAEGSIPEEKFNCRPLICSLIPEKFKLDTIFEYTKHQDSILSLGSSNNMSMGKNSAVEYTCYVQHIVGYYGRHYIAFVSTNGDDWIKYDDNKVQNIGSFKNLVKYFCTYKIIPYLVFYKWDKGCGSECSDKEDFKSCCSTEFLKANKRSSNFLANESINSSLSKIGRCQI